MRKRTLSIAKPSAVADDSDYLRGVAGLARYLRISERCASNWMAKKIVPYFKVGKAVLFRKSEVAAALAKFEVRAV
ncbi:MAG TPA: hypothetical protein DCM68_05095 [Verrucomicrobia bacterium]|nr:hypothetical protein [Verrucomicrobiota bacterium]